MTKEDKFIEESAKAIAETLKGVKKELDKAKIPEKLSGYCDTPHGMVRIKENELKGNKKARSWVEKLLKD